VTLLRYISFSPLPRFGRGYPGSKRERSQERSGESKCFVGGTGLDSGERNATELRGRESSPGEPTKQNGDERRARSGHRPSSAAVPDRYGAKENEAVPERLRVPPIKPISKNRSQSSIWLKMKLTRARDNVRYGLTKSSRRTARTAFSTRAGETTLLLRYRCEQPIVRVDALPAQFRSGAKNLRPATARRKQSRSDVLAMNAEERSIYPQRLNRGSGLPRPSGRSPCTPATPMWRRNHADLARARSIWAGA
jgi:hypothetical protein